MCSNVYYGIKDSDINYSFEEAQWITPYEVFRQLKYSTINNEYLTQNLIYPNELLLNESNKIVDILLLAKYRNKCGNIKLKSVLFSQLITQYCGTLSTNYNLLILKLPIDSYYWSSSANNNLIPSFSLRAGYNQTTKQFSYIGRMKVSSLLSPVGQIPIRNDSSLKFKKVSSSITNFIGTLTHFYEYIPAIVLQLHDLSYLDEKKLMNLSQNEIQDSQSIRNINQRESFWKRIKTSILSNNSSRDMDFNVISGDNYEVLCLKKQPATLKQRCILKLNDINEFYFKKNYKEPYLAFISLPNSIKNLLWPSYLMPGQCLVKKSKMRSLNGIYEININQDGNFKLIKYSFDNIMSKKIITFEKNLESLFVSQIGVYLIYDNNQATRKPTVLYKHSSKIASKSDSNDLMVDFSISPYILDNCRESFILELSDAGYLRVVVQTFIKDSRENFTVYKSSSRVINILNLNDSFKPMTLENNEPKINKPVMSIEKINSPSSTILSITIILNDFRDFQKKIFHVIKRLFKNVVQNFRNVRVLRN